MGVSQTGPSTRRQTASVATGGAWGDGWGCGTFEPGLRASQRLLGSEEGRERHPGEKSGWAQRLRDGKGHPAFGGRVIFGYDWSKVMEMTPESSTGASLRRAGSQGVWTWFRRQWEPLMALEQGTD